MQCKWGAYCDTNGRSTDSISLSSERRGTKSTAIALRENCREVLEIFLLEEKELGPKRSRPFQANQSSELNFPIFPGEKGPNSEERGISTKPLLTAMAQVVPFPVLTIFDFFLPCAKDVEKRQNVFDTFCRSLLWPLATGHYCSPLKEVPPEAVPSRSSPSLGKRFNRSLVRTGVLARVLKSPSNPQNCRKKEKMLKKGTFIFCANSGMHQTLV